VKPAGSRTGVAIELHRLATCLVHTVPTAVGLVTTHAGDRLVAARNRADATLDPCQLRAAITAPTQPGVWLHAHCLVEELTDVARDAHPERPA
jgi:hypothetical protein